MFSQHGKSPARKLVGAIVGTCAGIALLGVAYSARATLHPHAQVNPGRTNYDPTIQEMATEALQRGLENSQASAGFAIVSDALSGKVLSAVNINNGFDSGLQGDWALSYSMSPASGIKSLILASALQHSAVTVDQVFDTENGTYQFGKMTLHDAEPIAKLSSAEVVVHSSNIGIIKIAQAMGSRGLEKMFQEFGIGSGESIGDFPSARAGVVPSAGNIEDASYVVLTALGSSNRTGLATTPLEMVQAYGAIANGGRLMRAIPMDGTTAPSLVRNVLSKETAAQMRKVLRQAVTEGTGQTIQESSVMLAGKTLTNILSDNRRVGGFIGFAPADNPKLVIYVVMLDTKLPHAAGSNTAAYVFRDIAEKAIPEWTKR